MDLLGATVTPLERCYHLREQEAMSRKYRRRMELCQLVLERSAGFPGMPFVELDQSHCH